ncbi:MAG: hypothetical protein DHS20C18_22820 [Saprospiraceae bacterium]|nr:MAG: hypothetical protein DHS20C18_22820 [Saprospiraceae bacterium]
MYLKLSIFSIIIGVLAFLISCDSNPYKQGAILYENFCASCHMEDGVGLEGLIPPLAGADYLKNANLQTTCIIRKGISDTITVNGRQYTDPMAGIPQLSDFEITNIINYINQAWGNDFGYVKLEDVRETLENCR